MTQATEQGLAYGRATLDRAAMAEDRPLSFVASPEGQNRCGFSLRNDGWRLDNFNANPVVLWMHNAFRPPIGQGRALTKDGSVILDDVRFDQEDELARSVESKFRSGFLNAVSVGWDFQAEDGTPVNVWSVKPEQARDELFYDLHEVSAVTVPGDPRALVQQSRLALANLGKELLDMFDDGQQPESSITAEQLRAAVVAELDRRWYAAPKLNATPSAPPEGISTDAAQGLLAVFGETEGTQS